MWDWLDISNWHIPRYPDLWTPFHSCGNETFDIQVRTWCAKLVLGWSRKQERSCFTSSGPGLKYLKRLHDVSRIPLHGCKQARRKHCVSPFFCVRVREQANSWNGEHIDSSALQTQTGPGKVVITSRKGTVQSLNYQNCQSKEGRCWLRPWLRAHFHEQPSRVIDPCWWHRKNSPGSSPDVWFHTTFTLHKGNRGGGGGGHEGSVPFPITWSPSKRVKRCKGKREKTEKGLDIRNRWGGLCQRVSVK